MSIVSGAKLSSIEKACMDKGLRMTEQRRVIARVVAEPTIIPTPKNCYRRAVAVDAYLDRDRLSHGEAVRGRRHP